MKPKIFIFIVNQWDGDVAAAALAENGVYITSHICSNRSWAEHDMGLRGDWKHNHYAAHYPDGYELVNLLHTDPETNPEFCAALAIVKANVQG
jgi:hypothetical protein